MNLDFTSPTIDRSQFIEWAMERVFVAPNGCWLWEGADSGQDIQTRGAGYAKTKVGRKTRYVHRLSYQICVGPIPAGLQIDHKCKHWFKDAIDYGNAIIYRRCINPDHLEAVTQSDNIKRNLFACQGVLNV